MAIDPKILKHIGFQELECDNEHRTNYSYVGFLEFYGLSDVIFIKNEKNSNHWFMFRAYDVGDEYKTLFGYIVEDIPHIRNFIHQTLIEIGKEIKAKEIKSALYITKDKT